MKRKLRKSLSWLLTVAMIFSLFCGMIPTASAADEPEIKEYHFMDIAEFQDLCLSKANVDPQDLHLLNVTSITQIQIYSTDGTSHTSDSVGIDVWYDMYTKNAITTTGELGHYIQPNEIAKIEVKVSYWLKSEPDYQITSVVLYKDDFDVETFPGENFAELTVKEDTGEDENQCVVTFWYQPGFSNYEQWARVEVEKGTSLGDKMPETPSVGNGHFVGWQSVSSDGSGAEFTSETIVDDDMNVYATKTTLAGGTAYHIMKNYIKTDQTVVEDALFKAILDKYNSDNGNQSEEISDVSKVQVSTISVLGKDGDHTNPNYFRNGWENTYYYVANNSAENIWGDSSSAHNTHVPVDEITGIEISGTIDGNEFQYTFTTSEFDKVTVNNPGTSDTIIELRVKYVPDDDQKPSAPSVTDLESIFNDQIRVTCANNHKMISYGIDEVEGGYSVEGAAVTQEGDSWTYTVTINYVPFVEKYKIDVEEERHALVDTSVTTEDVKLVWDSKDWAAAEDQLPVVIETVCTNPQVDYIQVNMSSAVKERYDSFGEGAPARWIHIDLTESSSTWPHYYVMWGDNTRHRSGNTSENEIVGVTLGATLIEDRMYFSMSGDNEEYAQIEVSYGYDGDDYIMYLYC